MVLAAFGRSAVVIALVMVLGGCATVFKQHLEASRELAEACEVISRDPAPQTLQLDQYVEVVESRAWPTVSSCPDVGTMLGGIQGGGVPQSTSLLTCGLRQKLFPLTQRAGSSEWKRIEPHAIALRQSVDAAHKEWSKVRGKLQGVVAQWQGMTPEQRGTFTLHAWVFRRHLLEDWRSFDHSLGKVLLAADALDRAVRVMDGDPAWAAFRLEMLAYGENLRATLGKARSIAVEEAGVLRDQAYASIQENFATRYLRAVDRSLLPLERGFERFDEKAYGAGTIASFTLSGSIDKILLDSYHATQRTLCRNTCQPETERPRYTNVLLRGFIQAVGRGACKRLDEPTDAASSAMLMQYVYRFHARIAKETYATPQVPEGGSASIFPGAGVETRTSGNTAAVTAESLLRASATDDVRKPQLLQHALAEWTVRDALILEDLKQQERGFAARGATPATATGPSLIARAPSEFFVESQAREGAAVSLAESWARAPLDGALSASLARSLTAQNNISVMQHVAVQVLNQQTVVNNIRVDAAPAAGDATGRVRFEPAVIQVNLPPPPAREAAASFCSGADEGKCADIVNGFRWRLGDFGVGRYQLPDRAAAEIVQVRQQIDRVLSARPNAPVRVEVHGFASPEAYTCGALQSRGHGRAGTAEVTAYAPACNGAASANPRLSFQRALEVRKALQAGAPADRRLQFAPPIAHGDSDPASGRSVEIRVFAGP